MVPCYGESIHTRSHTYRQYHHLVHDVHVGGLIVIGHTLNGSIRNAEPYAMAAFLNRMQKLAKLPLLVGADFERGASMRVNNTTPWPQNMAFGAARDLEDARYEGAETAREARALGVQWIFAPVADVNNNPDNPIINIRSYGEDPAQVARFVEAYIDGAHQDQKHPVLVTVKHFPGHGDTNEDSHLGMPRLAASRERLDQIELVPFRAAITHHVDAVMTAHMAVAALDPQDIPATVSSAVLTGLLRGELKFDGLVITDAMEMQGLSKLLDSGEAAVRALDAGADVLLMPVHPEDAIRGVLAAVKSGRLTRKRIDASVIRVLAAKIRVGLQRSRVVDLEAIADVVNSPEAEERAQAVAERALTLVKDSGNLLPLKAPETACLHVLLEGRYGQQGRRFIEEVRKHAPKMAVNLLDPAMTADDLHRTADAASSCAINVIAAYSAVGVWPEFVNTLIHNGKPSLLLSFGNPYLIRNFPDANAFLAAFSTTTTSETAIARALFGEIPVTGKLPVTIPGIAKIGDGIERKGN